MAQWKIDPYSLALRVEQPNAVWVSNGICAAFKADNLDILITDIRSMASRYEAVETRIRQCQEAYVERFGIAGVRSCSSMLWFLVRLAWELQTWQDRYCDSKGDFCLCTTTRCYNYGMGCYDHNTTFAAQVLSKHIHLTCHLKEQYRKYRWHPLFKLLVSRQTGLIYDVGQIIGSYMIDLSSPSDLLSRYILQVPIRLHHLDQSEIILLYPEVSMQLCQLEAKKKAIKAPLPQPDNTEITVLNKLQRAHGIYRSRNIKNKRIMNKQRRKRK